MRKKLSRICSTAILAVIIIVSIVKISNLMELKESDNRYASFFVEEQPIDVLFVGSSHVRHGFFVMELWNDYGISAYNLAGNGSTLPVSYWTLVNALDYQTPKVVVMDVFDMWPGRIFSNSWGQVHQQLDAFPISINKYRMIRDLFDDRELTDGSGNPIYNKRWEIFWNLGEYHTRWTGLTEGDFDSEKTLIQNSRVWKGSEPLIDVVEREEHIYNKSADELQYDDVARDYLERMISLCKERGIELLLINTSYDCSDEAKLFHDSVNEIAEANSLLYLDFTQENIINFDTDLYTTGHNTHVNFSGAEKFAAYIGGKLKENYELEDHRTNPDYERWTEDYEAFVESKEQYLRDQTDVVKYMLLLSDKSYRIIFEIRDATVLSETNVAGMFANLGIDITGENNLICIDMEEQSIDCLDNDYLTGSEWNTAVGLLHLDVNEEGIYEMYLNGDELYRVDPGEDNSKLKITVIRKKTGDVIDVKSF